MQPAPTVNLRSRRDSAKAFAAPHARRFRHRRNQASFTRSRKSSCPLRLEEGEASQELDGLLRPSPSHCGGEDHQPRATPCPAELRVGPLLSSPQSAAPLLAVPSRCSGDTTTISKRRPSTLGSATSQVPDHHVGRDSSSNFSAHLSARRLQCTTPTTENPSFRTGSAMVAKDVMETASSAAGS